MIRRRLTSAYLLIWILCSLPAAQAATFYIEVGPGLSSITGGSTVFNNTFNTGTSAFSANAMFAWDAPIAKSFGVHLGVRGQWLSAINGLTYGNIYALYPFIRVEFWRIYLGGGATPFALRRVGPAPGIDGAAEISGALPFFAEAGLEWKIIPDFHLCFGVTGHGAYQTVGLPANASPFIMFPSLEYSVQFRFLFDIGGKGNAGATGGGSSSVKKFDGWRYPFGIGR